MTGNQRQAPTATVLASVFLLLGAATVASYWPGLLYMGTRWAREAEYSHGYLVPVFCLVLLWLRRDLLDMQSVRPNPWGLALIGGGVVLRMISVYFYFEWFDYLSLIPTVMGLVVLVGGVAAFRWAWPSVLFLAFMIPLPHTLQTAMQGPLQRLGTVASCFIMQTMGMAAIAEGNTIIASGEAINVAEACSGLRMLMVFFALSAAVALLADLQLWQRGVVLLSAVPIALASNVMRITITGIYYTLSWQPIDPDIFHEYVAGYLMMPLGLLLLFAELWFLSRLFVEVEDRPLDIGLGVEPSLTTVP